MKNKILIGLAAILLVVSTAAQADHDDPIGSVGLLQSETEELEEAVRGSWLRYHVKQAVFRFASDVNSLANCVKFGPRPIINDHLDEPGVPRRCSSGLYRAKSSFRSVDRYLYDTNYDFPRIFRIYREVKRALRAVYVIGGGGGPGGGGPGVQSFKCVAMDSGWEEHFGGHTAFGRSPSMAKRRAISQCERFHGRCRIQSCNQVR